MKCIMTFAMFAMAAGAVHADTITYTGPSSSSEYIQLSMDKLSDGTYLWSDRQAPHPGGDYVVEKETYLNTAGGTTADKEGAYTFPGSSLTFTSGLAYWENRTHDFTANNVVVQSSAQFRLVTRRNHDRGAIDDQVLKGNGWQIDGELQLFTIYMRSPYYVEVPLSGAGQVTFGGWKDPGDLGGRTPSDCKITSVNPDFIGKISFNTPWAENKETASGLQIANPLALGGARPEFTYDALSVGPYNGLHATESMVLDTSNCGIAINTGYFEVDAGKTLTVNEPIRILGNGFYKRGAGTLTLGCDFSFGADGTDEADGANSRVEVEAGALKPLVSCAELDLSFAAGTSLTLAAFPDDEGMAEKGIEPRSLTAEGNEFVVELEFPASGYESGKAYDIPLFTLSQADAAAVEDALRVAVKGDASSVPVEKVAVEGKVFFSARAVAPSKIVRTVQRDGSGAFVPVTLSAAEIGSSGRVLLINGGAALSKADDGKRFLVATLESGVREMMAADFTLEGFVAGSAAKETVEIDGAVGGVRSVYVRISEMVLYTGPAQLQYLTAAQASDGTYLWSDKAEPHDGAHYGVMNGNWVITAAKDSTTMEGFYTFPGASLTFLANGGQSTWEDVGHYFTANDVVIKPGATLRLVTQRHHERWSIDEQVVRGSGWRIDGELQLWTLYIRSPYWVEFPFSGAGQVTFGGYKAVSSDNLVASDCKITSVNPDFTGKISFNTPWAENEETASALQISNPLSLGGARAAFAYDALNIGPYNGLHVTETMTLDTLNRGIALSGSYFEVDADKTLTVTQPIRILERGFYKRGEGVLALGCDFSFGADGTAAADGANNAFSVKAGGIKPLSAVGLQKLNMTIEDGVSLVLDAFPKDAGVAEKGLYMPRAGSLAVAGSTLPVKILIPSDRQIQTVAKVALCTVPAAEADALLGKMSVSLVGAKGLMAELSAVDAGDGLKRIEAEVSKRGMAIFIR